MSVNKVILVGRLGQDPDVRYMPNETAVCNFSLATSSSYKDKTGAKVDQTEWHRIVMFGKIAEIAKEYLKKGSQVYIEGKISNRSYEDKEGVKKYISEIVGRDIRLLGRAPESSGNEPSSSSSQETKESVQEDDLPF